MGVSVYGCVRARVVHDYMSVIPRAKPICQQPKQGSTSWPRHLEMILHGPCTKFAKILGSWARSWARSWPHGQDLEHIAQVSWPRTFCWVKVGHFCLLEESHFVSATWR